MILPGACLHAPACNIGVLASMHEATIQNCLWPLRPRCMRRGCNLADGSASGLWQDLPLLTTDLDMRWRSALVPCWERMGLLCTLDESHGWECSPHWVARSDLRLMSRRMQQHQDAFGHVMFQLRGVRATVSMFTL